MKSWREYEISVKIPSYFKQALNLRKSWKVFESALRDRKNQKEIDHELSQ